MAFVTTESWLNHPKRRERKEALTAPFSRPAIPSPPLLSSYLGPTQFQGNPSSQLTKALGKTLCFALGRLSVFQSPSKHTLTTSFTLTFSFFLVASR